MENKTLIIIAIISAIGSFFEPSISDLSKCKKKKKDATTCEAEHYIDSIRVVNDSLLHSLKIENKALIQDNSRLKNKRKYYITKNGKKVHR
ncbi:MAG: hypothetical protein Unbinned2819contig1004_23 [Prokaryotic dsDNA virus sp.]|nr:MAG: hypothetical protein Unbinned2819contig1004_23 [Prokaryotic dsDNA virus sp.]|tara:strand:- start:1916 stop:2188 length:273 start_codon:yes stop_codon:yes gene_type:complete